MTLTDLASSSMSSQSLGQYLKSCTLLWRFIYRQKTCWQLLLLWVPVLMWAIKKNWLTFSWGNSVKMEWVELQEYLLNNVQALKVQINWNILWELLLAITEPWIPIQKKCDSTFHTESTHRVISILSCWWRPKLFDSLQSSSDCSYHLTLVWEAPV